MVANKQAAQLVMLNHQREQRDRRLQSRSSRVDHRADGRILNSDRANNSSQRAEPVCGVDHVWAGDAGEKIFCSTGESNNFMWKDRAENNNMIIFQRGLVDANIDFIWQ